MAMNNPTFSVYTSSSLSQEHTIEVSGSGEPPGGTPPITPDIFSELDAMEQAIIHCKTQLVNIFTILNLTQQSLRKVRTKLTEINDV